MALRSIVFMAMVSSLAPFLQRSSKYWTKWPVMLAVRRSFTPLVSKGAFFQISLRIARTLPLM